MKFTATGSRTVVTRSWWGGGWDGELLHNGDRVLVGEDEKVLEINSEDDCTLMLTYLMPLN